MISLKFFKKHNEYFTDEIFVQLLLYENIIGQLYIRVEELDNIEIIDSKDLEHFIEMEKIESYELIFNNEQICFLKTIINKLKQQTKTREKEAVLVFKDPNEYPYYQNNIKKIFIIELEKIIKELK